jgi:hypothetical protein
MTHDQRQSVQAALDLLAQRLDPILGTRLKKVLGPLPWTAVLEQLDQVKGFTAKTYTTNDLQAQLRMITEKLGALGYPFDTGGSRLVSTLGNELRIVRNRWAHNDEFSPLDAWRAYDFVCRLLDHFGDKEGLAKAQCGRRVALAAAATAEGVSEREVETRDPVTQAEQPPDPEPAAESAEIVTPDPKVFERAEAKPFRLIEQVEQGTLFSHRPEPTPEPHPEPMPLVGNRRAEFEPWTPVVVGTVSVLDDLPKKAAKEQVRALAVEIAEFEGPIHIDRLAQLIAASFGLRRLHAARAKKITYQIMATEGLTVDSDKFVWPSTIDSETWAEFRPNDSTANRPFPHISPVEIANAAHFLLRQTPGLLEDELETATLQTFGRRRRTRRLSEHLAVALSRPA